MPVTTAAKASSPMRRKMETRRERTGILKVVDKAMVWIEGVFEESNDIETLLERLGMVVSVVQTAVMDAERSKRTEAGVIDVNTGDGMHGVVFTFKSHQCQPGNGGEDCIRQTVRKHCASSLAKVGGRSSTTAPYLRRHAGMQEL